jgi:hypothetical protein
MTVNGPPVGSFPLVIWNVRSEIGISGVGDFMAVAYMGRTRVRLTFGPLGIDRVRRCWFSNHRSDENDCQRGWEKKLVLGYTEKNYEG